MSVVELLARSQGKEDVVGRIYGAVVGVVTQIDDPDGRGRVRVSYPWLQDSGDSPWARLATLMAGAERGTVFRPEVGDEVLVVFEHGDVRFPYVIGALWNGSDAMPAERGSDADNHVRLIRSRSGHRVILDDTPGSEKVSVIDSHGNRLDMSADGVVIKSQAIRLGDGAAEALVLGDAFLQLFNSHTHPTGVGPSGPPAQPMTASSHLSREHKVK